VAEFHPAFSDKIKQNKYRAQAEKKGIKRPGDATQYKCTQGNQKCNALQLHHPTRKRTFKAERAQAIDPSAVGSIRFVHDSGVAACR
jgi:hypothetical protein